LSTLESRAIEVLIASLVKVAVTNPNRAMAGVMYCAAEVADPGSSATKKLIMIKNMTARMHLGDWGRRNLTRGCAPSVGTLVRCLLSDL